jgi:hypothetical protein
MQRWLTDNPDSVLYTNKYAAQHTLFLPLLLLRAPRRRRRGCVGVNQDRLVFTSDLCLVRLVIQLLHELILDGRAPLLPPLLFVLGLRLDLVEPLPQRRVGCNLVC